MQQRLSELLPQIQQLSRTDKLRIIEFIASSLAKEQTLLSSENQSISEDDQIINLQLLNLQNNLKNYENKYQMSSELFSKKFRQGELGNEIDFFEWGVYSEMLLSAETELV